MHGVVSKRRSAGATGRGRGLLLACGLLVYFLF
jgi:hypothetical protein